MSFFYTEVEGEFIIKARVYHDFIATYDANGVNVDGNEVWLQIARKNDVFAIHYSFDGIKFFMSRICSLPMQNRIKVGLVAQSPIGNGATMKFEHVSLEFKSLEDIRGGNQ